MMVMEHVLLGFKIMMMYVIDDVPRWIREAIAQRNAQQRTASCAARISKYASGEIETLQKAVSPKSRAARRTSTATAAFLHSLSGKPQKGSTHSHAASPRSASAAQGNAPPVISSERDDVSVLTETSEKPFLRQRASNFLNHFTGRTKTAHTHASSSHNTSTNSIVAPGTAAQSAASSTSAAPVQDSARADAMLDEIAQMTELHNEDYPPIDEPEFIETFNAAAHRESATDRLVKETASPFGFDPSHMMILICLPLALDYFNITPWLYLPAAVLFFGYLQSKKDRIDRKIAMGIVSDPTLLKLILEEMPSWPIDGEFQQLVCLLLRRAH